MRSKNATSVLCSRSLNLQSYPEECDSRMFFSLKWKKVGAQTKLLQTFPDSKHFFEGLRTTQPEENGAASFVRMIKVQMKNNLYNYFAKCSMHLTAAGISTVTKFSSCHGAVAQSVERPSKGPGSRSSSTDAGSNSGAAV